MAMNSPPNGSENERDVQELFRRYRTAVDANLNSPEFKERIRNGIQRRLGKSDGEVVELAVTQFIELSKKAARYCKQRKLDEALNLTQRAIDALRRVQPVPNRPEIAVQLSNLAAVALAAGQHSFAEELLFSALAIGQKVWQSNDPRLVRFLQNLASLSHSQGEHLQAEKHYLKALAVLESSGQANDLVGVTILNNLGTLYLEMDKCEKAEQLFLRSIALLSNESHRIGTTVFTTTVQKLAYAVNKQGRSAEARAILEKAGLPTASQAHGNVPAHGDPLDSSGRVKGISTRKDT
ncbi:MAG TPA: tetratricopeptide repeat protein [Gemmataceae bacterium]|jgi:tetratricopeptide (TPR) repeat protein